MSCAKTFVILLFSVFYDFQSYFMMRLFLLSSWSTSCTSPFSRSSTSSVLPWSSSVTIGTSEKGAGTANRWRPQSSAPWLQNQKLCPTAKVPKRNDKTTSRLKLIPIDILSNKLLLQSISSFYELLSLNQKCLPKAAAQKSKFFSFFY